MGQFADWFTQEIQRHPYALRTTLRWLDTLAPRALVGRAAIHSSTVREVFERPSEFLMGYLNQPKLKLGNFLLGMDPGPMHEKEKLQLIAALDASLDAFPRVVAAEAEQAAHHLCAAWSRSQRIDLIAEFVEPVFVRSLAHYFGIPIQGLHCEALATAPGERTLAQVIRKLGTTIASSHPAPFGLEKTANAIAPVFRQHLMNAVIAHRNGTIADKVDGIAGGLTPLAPDRTVIAHLIAASDLDDGDAGIVRCVGGMLSASAGYPKAFAHALHELLARPEQLAGFVRATLDDDRPAAHAYVKEALRFRPVFPLLVRYCPHATQLRSDAADVPAQATLPLFPLSAMFDPSAVRDPEHFIAGRPEDSYWLFGGAPRVCIGRRLIMDMFMPMFRALFSAVPQLQQAKPGELHYDGAGIDRYVLSAS